jgi:hypothetical protein
MQNGGSSNSKEVWNFQGGQKEVWIQQKIGTAGLRQVAQKCWSRWFGKMCFGGRADNGGIMGEVVGRWWLVRNV